MAMASMLDPHRRFTVVPGTSTGSPASSNAIRPHVAVVLASLVGATVDDIVHRGPVHLRVALEQRAQRNGAEIVGADMGEGAAVATDGGSDGVADEGVWHDSELSKECG